MPTILQGDCNEVLKTRARSSVDLVLTDPPYLVNYRDRTGRTIANDLDPTSVMASFTQIYRVLKPNSFMVCFYGWNKIDLFFRSWKKAGFRPVGHVVWAKNYASSTRFFKTQHEQAYLLAKGRPDTPDDPISDVRPWEYTGNRAHPTEKAVSILSPLIKAFSNPGDTVLDPFAGSGSTLVAAALCNRKPIGIELDERYCKLANRRLAGVTRFIAREEALAV